MIYILHGDDDFSKREFLDGLRTAVGPPDLLEANTTTLQTTGLTMMHLRGVCSAVPFLAVHRLIIVEGFLAQFDVSPWERRRGRPPGSRAIPEEWSSLAETLSTLPQTTILVFWEGGLRRDNPLLEAIMPAVEVREFRPLSGADLDRWVRQRVTGMSAQISQGAVRRLIDLVGGNLWVLAREIEKLALYAAGGTIEEGAVHLLVAQSREASIFRAVDAVLEGRAASALEQMSRLRQSGAEAGYIITMLGRQLRLVLLAHELIPQRLSREEVGRRLGLAEFAIRPLEQQARRHSHQRVLAMYRGLLETDLAIKRGEVEEGLALETLIAGMCQDSDRVAARPSRGGPR
ncbi:MAG: DNA polymerase III subunit delta [Chloroflexi bacterium]|nr:DNA polymerase III subunit delta [Chloroflexota bacterium]